MPYNTESIADYSPRFNVIHVKNLLSDILVEEQNSDYTVCIEGQIEEQMEILYVVFVSLSKFVV